MNKVSYNYLHYLTFTLFNICHKGAKCDSQIWRSKKRQLKDEGSGISMSLTVMNPLESQVGGVESPLSIVLHRLGVGELFGESTPPRARG